MDIFGNFNGKSNNPSGQPKPGGVPLRSMIFIGAILLFFLSFGSSLFETIKPGYAAVIFKRFGGGIDEKNIYNSGFHIKAPWNYFVVYDVRYQELPEKSDVLSKNGLNIEVDVSIRYKLFPRLIGNLHNTIGVDYEKSVLIPEVRSVIRSVIGRYLPEELYSTKREIIQNEIFQETNEQLKKKFIELDAILIRSVNLPATIQTAIETKLKQEQEFLEYEFKIEKAKKEADRKEIEARGKALANKILNSSLTVKILQDKGIEATLKLAESPNSKVVIIGDSKNGLPIILGGDK